MQVTPETPDQNSNDRGDPFNMPVAGESLTREAGQNPMESPPKHTDPDVVYSKLADKFSKPEIKERIIELFAAGIPIEVIINVLTKHIAYQGIVNPDLAELIKPSLTVFFVQMAQEADIPFEIFLEDEEADQQALEGRQEMLMETLGSQRPEMVEDMKGIQFRDDLKERALEAQKTVAARREIDQRIEDSPVESDGSFLDLGESE